MPMSSKSMCVVCCVEDPYFDLTNAYQDGVVFANAVANVALNTANKVF